MEFVGEVIATTFGLTQSNYQWVIDAGEEDKRRARRQAEVEKNRREIIDGEAELKEILLAQGAEAGGDSENEENLGGD